MLFQQEKFAAWNLLKRIGAVDKRDGHGKNIEKLKKLNYFQQHEWVQWANEI